VSIALIKRFDVLGDVRQNQSSAIQFFKKNTSRSEIFILRRYGKI
jgi:hypothetical protein